MNVVTLGIQHATVGELSEVVPAPLSGRHRRPALTGLIALMLQSPVGMEAVTLREG